MRGALAGIASTLVLALTQAAPAMASRPLNLLPNPSFEAGDIAPAGWTLSAVGAGGWETGASDGRRCISVTGMGDDSTWWAPAAPVRLEPGRLYYAAYSLRAGPQASGGVAIAGLDLVNRDARPTREWTRESFFFRTPDTPLTNAFFRLGEWHVRGAVLFDQASLTPALAVHRRPGELDLPLGDGESIVAGRYRAAHPLGGPGSTHFRGIERFSAHFNSNRWVFGDGSQVVYRHRVGRLRQTAAEIEIGVNLRETGELIIEASGDGEQWTPVGEIAEIARRAYPVPAGLLPAREVWVRLRSTPGASLQVNAYEYHCRLPEADSVARAVGATHYLALAAQERNLDVDVIGLGDLLPGGDSVVEVALQTRSGRLAVRATVAVEKDGATAFLSQQRASLTEELPRRLSLPYGLVATGDHTLRLTFADAVTDEVLWEAMAEFTVPPLYDVRGGELLLEDGGIAAWWCEPEWKVSRGRPAPDTIGPSMRISLAANEWEAAQLVVRPRSPVRECRVSVSDLVAESGARIPASAVEVRVVEYVFVAQPTDEVGIADRWPDPLPPHREPLALEAGQNQPFWITVHAPAGTPAGDYRGTVEVLADGLPLRVPLHVRVWGFDLPRETHVRSGFGLWSGAIRRYHNLETEAELDRVFDLYLESFADHRVAPYSLGSGIGVEWTKSPDGAVTPSLDFTAFDSAARRGLDQLGFNSFVLHLEGLGGGTYHSRHLGRIAGFEQGTPQHEAAFTRYVRAVQDHLEDRGWLDEAYLYWFDEPDEKDYEFVREGMALIHRGGPKLTRMLTEHPTPELYGAVDVWCLPTYMLSEDAVRERQRAGEGIWWYLCTGPKAPYFTLFLDHHGTEMRLWLWETWKYGIDGILVWQTNYWTSDAAYPDPATQNPWQDAMSWTSGYSTPAGVKNPWGNGDGRFLYPPNRDPANDARKHLDGPVPSIRWELLRDGIEDYEYFWLLREEIRRLKASGARPSVYSAAEALLEVPADVCTDLTHFTTTPDPIHRHRAQLGAAIEDLRRH